MTNKDKSPDLSLVPFPSEHREVILRHGSSVVLFDHRSQQITLANSADVEPGICPRCHRPFPKSTDDAHWTSESFMSPDYFNLLHRSREASVVASRSPSPQRLLRSQESTPARRRPVVEVESDEEEDEPEYVQSSSNISADSFSHGYFDKHFVEVKELGRGGNGVVLLVKHVLHGQEIGLLAMKRIPVGDDVPWLQKVLREVRVLQGLSHPNLVSYKHVWLEYFQPTAFTPRVPHAFILQQYCNRGDLQSHIFGSSLDIADHTLKQRRRPRSLAQDSASDKDQARHLHPEEVFGFFKDIASGLNSLHKAAFIHRDLKPSNCLLHESNGKLHCLVSDFGETAAENAARRSTGGTGTVSYCAPEVLRRDPLNGSFGNFTQKSDIFSLGLILYLMCFGRLPYSHANPFDETTEDIDKLREEIAAWAGISDERNGQSNLPEVLSGSLGRLLSLNPSDRPNSQEVLQGLKNFGFRPRGRSNVGIESESWFRGPSDNLSSASPSSPIRRNSGLATRDRSSSQYQPPAVESENPRSPPLSPVNSKVNRPLSPVKAETSFIRRQRPKELLELKSSSQPQLILPAPRSTTTLLFDQIFHSTLTGALTRSCIFVVKVWTVLAPCQPNAAQPLVAYPLLFLAAMDLSGLNVSSWFSIILASLHVSILALARHHNTLCQNHN